MSGSRPEETESAIGRTATRIYWFVVIDLLVVLASLPGAILLMLLAPDASNLPIVAIALVPLGPALSAAVYAWRDHDQERDLHPGQHFWRGYRLNALDVARLWVPALALLTVLGINATNLEAVGLPGTLRVTIAVIAVVVVLWTAHAVVLASVFNFRTRDVARLAIHYVAARPLVTLGVVSLLVVTLGLVLLVSDFVLGFAASVLTFWLWRNARTMVKDVEARFLRSPADSRGDPGAAR